jgi:hypothetical protein
VNTITELPLVYLISADDDVALRDLLTPDVVARLRQFGFGLALPLRHLTEATADALRLLTAAGVPFTLQLAAVNPPSDLFHVQNYPQARERFIQLRDWLKAEGLMPQALVLRVEPPAELPIAERGLNLRVLARHLWLAHENVLYQDAADAMAALCAEIRSAGMEVHSLQVPLVIDDRWAGTTLLQRAFDLIPIPADVELLLCRSSLNAAAADDRISSEVAALYADDADGLVLPFPTAARRAGRELPAELGAQLMFAAGSDVIYLAGLAEVVRADLFAAVQQALRQPPPISRVRPLRLRLLRAAVRGVLLLSRYWRPLLAWSGWLVAALIWWMDRRRAPAPPGIEDRHHGSH